MLKVPSNIGPPAAIQIRVSAPEGGVDLTTVTGASIGVLRQDGTQTTLAAGIVSQVANELLLFYTFVGGEITGTGAYYLAPLLTVPGGNLPVSTVVMMVTSPFQLPLPNLEEESVCYAQAVLLANGPFTPRWEAPPTEYTGSQILPAYPAQAIGLNSRAGGFTLTVSPQLQIGAVLNVEDWGNFTAANPVALASPYAWQDPTTLAIATGSYSFHESGKAHSWRLVNDATLGTYFKALK